MTTQAPLLLLDNLFDTIIHYPGATLSTSSELAGREAMRVADYRRDRSWWQTITNATNHYVAVDLSASVTANPDSLWIDRGHNLAGVTISVQSSDDAITWTTLVSRALPAAGVVGGDPTTGVAQTEEGACYLLFAAAAGAHRYWRFLIPATGQWQVPGLILGARTQLLTYSNSYDDDEAARKVRSEESDAGYVATGRVYAYRKATLDLAVIGDTEYDGRIRTIKRLMFERNAPAFFAFNFGLYPERAFLAQLDGTAWAMAKRGTYRSGKIPLREVGAPIV